MIKSFSRSNFPRLFTSSIRHFSEVSSKKLIDELEEEDENEEVTLASKEKQSYKHMIMKKLMTPIDLDDQKNAIIDDREIFIPTPISSEEKEFILLESGQNEVASALRINRNNTLKAGLQALNKLEIGADNFKILKKIGEETVFDLAHSKSISKLAPRRLLIFYSTAQKLRMVKQFKGVELMACLNKIAIYINKLSPDLVASFAVLLDRGKVYDERYSPY